jgi:hypothetical protein
MLDDVVVPKRQPAAARKADPGSLRKTALIA